MVTPPGPREVHVAPVSRPYSEPELSPKPGMRGLCGVKFPPTRCMPRMAKSMMENLQAFPGGVSVATLAQRIVPPGPFQSETEKKAPC